MRYFFSFLFIASLLFAQTAIYAQTARQAVVVEIVTSLGCSACPGAAMGGHDLVEHYGDSVIIIEHHPGDRLSNVSARDRARLFYGISATPTALFDGDNSRKLIGGRANSSMFNSYRGRVETARVIPSPVSLQLAFIDHGNNSYDAEVVITQHSASVPSDLRLQIVITESNVATGPWPGSSGHMDGASFVNRMMAPTAQGTPVSLAGLGQSTTVRVPFSLDPGWNEEELELIAFVEDFSNQNILQATKLTEWYPNNFQLDAWAQTLRVSDVSGQCGTIAPEVKFRNQGRTPITDLLVEYQINQEPVQQFSWSGNMPINTQESIVLPQVAYSNDPNGNELKVWLKQPNGQPDDDVSNNELSYRIRPNTQPTGNYVVQVSPDAPSNDFTWEVTDPDGNTLASGGPYTNGRPQFSTFFVDQPGCHQLKTYDATGDGLSEGGFIILYYAPGQDTLVFARDLGAQKDFNWEIERAQSNAPTLEANALKVTPNPFQDVLRVDIAHQTRGEVSLRLLTPAGRTVLYHDAGTHFGNSSHLLDVRELAAGMYLLRVQTGDGVRVTKVVKP